MAAIWLATLAYEPGEAEGVRELRILEMTTYEAL